MRKAALILGALLFLSTAASAQTSAPASQQAWKSASAAPVGEGQLFAIASPAPFAEASASPAPWFHSARREPQPIYGVVPDLNWQVYGGFSYTRFYEVPGATPNLFGFDFGLAYYPHVRWIAGEGDISATFGSQAGTSMQLVAEMGGIRLRWAMPSGSNLWVHGLAGGAYLSPKTIYGGQRAFAYEAGGGIDFTHRHSRVAYRVEADLVGTFFFGTYQYSPKASVGIVYKF